MELLSKDRNSSLKQDWRLALEWSIVVVAAVAVIVVAVVFVVFAAVVVVFAAVVVVVVVAVIAVAVVVVVFAAVVVAALCFVVLWQSKSSIFESDNSKMFLSQFCSS